jgi:soluble lytic murein transglycosylase-like protein
MGGRLAAHEQGAPTEVPTEEIGNPPWSGATTPSRPASHVRLAELSRPRGQLILLAARALLLGTMLVVVPPLMSAAPAQPLRLVDADGVVHLTNVPGDPRYRDLVSGSGTAARWLRLSARAPGRYALEIWEIARQYNVNPVLVEAVVATESGFDPAAVSPKGAGGLMQLMPRTASALGVVDSFDPRENIRGGVRHLRYLLERYHGSVVLALAAYNAGEGAVDTHRAMPPYPETQQYVQRVLRRAGLANSLASAEALHRYVGPDDVMTYSNLPPRPRH